MKPLDGTYAENADRHGVAGLNIDDSRIAAQGRPALVVDPKPEANGSVYAGRQSAGTGFDGGSKAVGVTDKGRWPTNLILDESAAAMLDVQSGCIKSGDGCVRRQEGSFLEHGGLGKSGDVQTTYGDMGGASRFFYCAKTSRSERNMGLGSEPKKKVSYMNTHGGNAEKGETWHPVDDRTGKERDRFSSENQNFHPTVKPTALMKYLCLLTKTPTGGIILDPFAGSGSTCVAAAMLGRPFIGIELNMEYADIAQKRIADALAQTKMNIDGA
jgi:hypothetical protein